MSGEAFSTTDHNVIRDWADDRGGLPAVIKNPATPEEELLRVHFLDMGDDDDLFRIISWQEFFELFEERQLEFIYQEYAKNGEKSFFCKLVKRKSS